MLNAILGQLAAIAAYAVAELSPADKVTVAGALRVALAKVEGRVVLKPLEPGE